MTSPFHLCLITLPSTPRWRSIYWNDDAYGVAERRKKRRKRGVVMIETLAAVLILAVVLTFILMVLIEMRASDSVR